MRPTRPFAALLCAALLAAAFDPAVADDGNAVLFRDARVLTMTDRGVIDGAQVLIVGDRIAAITTDAVEPPPGARIVDAEGATLMPGLADMHVHYFNADQGPLFVANGITTVRNPWGTTESIRFDEAARRGDLVGPHIYSSGPLMDGPEPIWGEASMKITSPELAVGAVESQRATGWKAVKLYEGLTPEIYRAAVKAAKERDMQVWTHVPIGLDVEDVIDLGVDSIEHFDNVNDSVFTVPEDGSREDDGRFFTRWALADPKKMKALARRSAKAGVWHAPTYAVIAKRYEYGAQADAFYARPEMAYVDDSIREWWRGSVSRMGEYTEDKRLAAGQQRAFLKALHDAGAPLLLGTDTPNPFVVPGFAIHDELAAFVEAGIPAAEVLRIATADAARFLREEGEWGVVAEGARADLVLVRGDPVADLATLRTPLGVMVNGHWRDRGALDAALAGVAGRIAAAREAGAETD